MPNRSSTSPIIPLVQPNQKHSNQSCDFFDDFCSAVLVVLGYTDAQPFAAVGRWELQHSGCWIAPDQMGFQRSCVLVLGESANLHAPLYSGPEGRWGFEYFNLHHGAAMAIDACFLSSGF